VDVVWLGLLDDLAALSKCAKGIPHGINLLETSVGFAGVVDTSSSPRRFTAAGVVEDGAVSQGNGGVVSGTSSRLKVSVQPPS
jgi:hypothetical protein